MEIKHIQPTINISSLKWLMVVYMQVVEVMEPHMFILLLFPHTEEKSRLVHHNSVLFLECSHQSQKSFTTMVFIVSSGM